MLLVGNNMPVLHTDQTFFSVLCVLALLFQSCHGKSNPFVNPVIVSELNGADFGAEN